MEGLAGAVQGRLALKLGAESRSHQSITEATAEVCNYVSCAYGCRASALPNNRVLGMQRVSPVVEAVVV